MNGTESYKMVHLPYSTIDKSWHFQILSEVTLGERNPIFLSSYSFEGTKCTIMTGKVQNGTATLLINL